jgi:RNA polymerase sigma-70 factor (ECF subfamily)
MRCTGDYHLASDILQESFTRYLEHYGDSLQSVSLLYTIGRNLVVDAARKTVRVTQPLEDSAAAEDDHEHQFMVRDQYREVLEAMQRLSGEERNILSLAATGELSYRQIASLNGISEANVKVKVHRARMKLRELLKAGDR